MVPIFCYIKYASFLFFSNINLNTKHLEIFTSDNGMSRGGDLQHQNLIILHKKRDSYIPLAF